MQSRRVCLLCLQLFCNKSATRAWASPWLPGPVLCPPPLAAAACPHAGPLHKVPGTSGSQNASHMFSPHTGSRGQTYTHRDSLVTGREWKQANRYGSKVVKLGMRRRTAPGRLRSPPTPWTVLLATPLAYPVRHTSAWSTPLASLASLMRLAGSTSLLQHWEQLIHQPLSALRMDHNMDTLRAQASI